MPTATTLTPAQALQRAFEDAWSKLDASLRTPLERACAMVKNGGVYQDAAGQWYAQRDTDPAPCPVNGACHCPQARAAVKHLCEHRLGVGLVVLRDKLLVAGLPDAETVVAPATQGEEATQGEAMDDDIFDPDMQEEPDNEDAEAGPSLAALADLDQYVSRAVQDALAGQPPSLPEAAFSLCLRGRLDGQDAQVTIRGATAEAFRANLREAREALAEARGLLDPVPEPSSLPAASEDDRTHAVPPGDPQETGWCPVHQVQMKHHKATNGGKDWWSHQLGPKVFCRGEA